MLQLILDCLCSYSYCSFKLVTTKIITVNLQGCPDVVGAPTAVEPNLDKMDLECLLRDLPKYSRGFLQLLRKHRKSSIQQLSSLVRLAWISGSYQNLCQMLLLLLKQGTCKCYCRPWNQWNPGQRKCCTYKVFFYMLTNPECYWIDIVNEIYAKMWMGASELL